MPLPEVDRGEIVPKRVFNLAGLQGKPATGRSLTDVDSLPNANRKSIKTYAKKPATPGAGVQFRSFGAHRQPHRAFQDSRQRQSFATGAFEARVPASPASRLSQAVNEGSYKSLIEAARDPPLTILRAKQVRISATPGCIRCSAAAEAAEAGAERRRPKDMKVMADRRTLRLVGEFRRAQPLGLAHGFHAAKTMKESKNVQYPS